MLEISTKLGSKARHTPGCGFEQKCFKAQKQIRVEGLTDEEGPESEIQSLSSTM